MERARGRVLRERKTGGGARRKGWEVR